MREQLRKAAPEVMQEKLSIKAKLILSDEEESHRPKVHMEWVIRSTSESRIQVRGYRLFFQKYDTGKWSSASPPSSFITNPHVISTLWENEERTYIWKQVDLSYYNIDSAGIWRYNLQFVFNMQNTSIPFTTPWIPSDEISISRIRHPIELDIIEQLVRDLPSLLMKEYELSAHPLVELSPKIERNMRPDILCYTEDGWAAVIEVSSRATENAISSVISYMNVVERKFARNTKSVIGILVTVEPPPPEYRGVVRIEEWKRLQGLLH